MDHGILFTVIEDVQGIVIMVYTINTFGIMQVRKCFLYTYREQLTYYGIFKVVYMNGGECFPFPVVTVWTLGKQ